MNHQLVKTVKLFDQTEKYGEIRNIFGVGDPHVAKINDQWVMFMGGFQRNFKNNIFTATLPAGETLDSNNWTIETYDDNPKKAKPIAPNSEKGSWDYYGYHTPCYVSGEDKNGEKAERIYYTGHGSKNVLDNHAPYSIGVFNKTPKGWERFPAPILTGTPESPNVLEPKVRFFKGKWRIWYVTTKQETGKKGYPQYRIQYVESLDGLTDWSEPENLFFEKENYYDASVHAAAVGYEMVVCRSTNLYGRNPFPKQGLWLLKGLEPNGKRNNWSSEPKLILDAENGENWYQNGTANPSCQYGDTKADINTLYVFFTGLNKQRNWLQIALRRLTKGKKPPFPSPFYFSIGRIELKRIEEDELT
ncbi:hypothetical protein D3H55_01995 [Bacillus salacetis]|uniref:DUF4185 domain-containing protein n=1 Tax=Bacillus salacetis TaxID=2315464 RepID=A0A3A1R565_9BACI|nr:hypothetical protein [Bacillus salacetis]RIW38336.1 hypothetical protein D3H55_01995 [Bacillus salacetis]